MFSRVVRSTPNRTLENPWREFATHTGLKFETDDQNRHNPGRISGMYNERWVDLSAYTVEDADGYFVMHMRVNVEIYNTSNSTVTIRQMRPLTRVQNNARTMLLRKLPLRRTSELAAVSTTPSDSGQDRRFLMMSTPEDYTMQLFCENISLHRRLGELHATEMTLLLDDKLSFEQVGVECDPEYLKFLLDLLCDYAVTVEQFNAARRKAANKQRETSRKGQLYAFP